MIVIKLGGSLLTAHTLLPCLNRIEQNYQGRAVVLVMGGGEFANQVRAAQQQWHFNDDCAHAMALLAMQQMAWLVKGLKANFELMPSVSAMQHSSATIMLWLPDIAELNKAGVPATWEITSDSLAAWLANRLSADELLVIKSAEIDESLSLAQLAEQGIIDKAFCTQVANSRFSVRVLNRQDL